MPRINNPATFHPDISEALMPELELQEYVLNHLVGRGYIVQQTGITRRKTQCPKCKSWFFAQGWGGSALGLQDFFIGRPEWGNHWVSIEMKTLAGLKLNGEPKAGDIKPEQQALVDLGVSVFARTLQQVLDVVEPLRIKFLDSDPWLAGNILD